MQDLVKNVLHFKKRSDSKNEVELRFKEFGLQHGVSYATFELLKQAFSNVTPKQENSIVYIKSNYRAIFVNKDIVFQNKQVLRKQDFTDYAVRIAESSETIVPSMDHEYFSNAFERTRQRSSFELDNCVLDLTRVKDTNGIYFEVELELMKNISVSVLTEVMHKILLTIQGGFNLMTLSSLEKIGQHYAGLLGDRYPRFVGPLPFTLMMSDLTKGKLNCGYSVTDKADGVRQLLYIDNKGRCFFIQRPTTGKVYPKYVSKVSDSSLYSCICDGELVRSKFLIFDVLVFNGKDVRNDNLIQRLKNIQFSHKASVPQPTNVQTETKLTLEVKTFYLYLDGHVYILKNGHIVAKNSKQTLYEAANYIWKKRANLPYELDGLIFTPIYEKYQNDFIYKWKPDNTIDFYIQKLNDRNSDTEKWELQIAGLIQNEYKHFGLSGPHKNKMFKVKRKGQLIEKQLEIPANKGIIRVPNKIAKKFESNSVVEFKYVNDAFVPVLSRADKFFANNVLSANDAWDAIKNPISIDVLKKGVMHTCIRKFHNDIKRGLIEKYASNNNVLDIGSGAGGDIEKYKQARARKVIGVDIVDVEYRYPEKSMAFFKVKGLYDIRNTLKKAKVPFEIPEQFDIVMCNFAVHYFFESQETLDNFIKNVTRNLKTGGLFVLTYMNGQKMNDDFGRKTTLRGEHNDVTFYKVSKKFKGKPKLVGNNISVDLYGTKYFDGATSHEYLVIPEFAQAYFAKHGLIVKESVGFESLCKKYKSSCSMLNSAEKEFSFYNMYQVYTKTT